MRIGFLLDTYKPYISGVTHSVSLTRSGLEALGHQVFLFVLGNVLREDEESHIVRSPGLRLPGTEFYAAWGYSVAARTLLQTMDVVHIHHPFVSGQIARRYRREFDAPLVFTYHTRYDLYARAHFPAVPAQVRNSILRAYFREFSRVVDAIISPSVGIVPSIREMGITRPIVVVPACVDVPLFRDAPATPRGAWGLSQSTVVFTCVCRLTREKNLSLLLRAFSILIGQVGDACLLLIGPGSPKMRRLLLELSQDLRIEGKVRLVGGASPDAVAGLLHMSDVFVTASVSETFGMAIVEASLSGLPVVAIDSPGICETTVDGRSGFLCPPDPKRIADKLALLAQDPALRKKMGSEGRTVSQRYSKERTAALLVQEYERLA